MRISIMLEAVMALLTAGGVGKRTCAGYGIDKRNGLFFLFAMAVLSRFTWYPADEAAVYPACIAAAAWLFGNAFKKDGTGLRRHLIVPVSILIGAALAPVTLAFPGYRHYAFALPAAVLGAFAGLDIALAVSGIAPIAASAAAFAYTVSTGGWMMLELTEACLCAQLAGVLAATGAKTAANVISTNVRKQSAESTIIE